MYTQSLPRIDNILWLTKLARPFPTTAGNILQVAKDWKFSKGTLDFLDTFPKDEIFESGDDFLTRCEEVELILKEERKMPYESLRVF